MAHSGPFGGGTVGRAIMGLLPWTLSPPRDVPVEGHISGGDTEVRVRVECPGHLCMAGQTHS